VLTQTLLPRQAFSLRRRLLIHQRAVEISGHVRSRYVAQRHRLPGSPTTMAVSWGRSTCHGPTHRPRPSLGPRDRSRI